MSEIAHHHLEVSCNGTRGFSHPALNTHPIYDNGNGSLVATVAVAWLTASQLGERISLTFLAL